MKISVFCLGYVGCVSLGCLSKMGHNVIGVDINEHKNDLINRGLPTIIDKGIDILIKKGRENSLIRATQNATEAILNSEISFICVGTPNDKNGHLNLNQIKTVASKIAIALPQKVGFHTIVIRSTVLPGTAEEISKIIADASHKIPGKDFCVLVNPEFLREGNAVDDFFNPSLTVIGGSDKKGIDLIMEIYKNIPGAKRVVDLRVSETIKLLNNSFHALKIAFANEIGTISKALDINTHQLIDIFLQDNKLNISQAYLQPGFAYGGSCLPKDLRALNLIAHDAYLETPLLNSIEKSNNHQIDRAISLIEEFKIQNIGFWGISFKDGTDDLRNSPIIQVIERLIGKGYKVYLFDEQVNDSQLIGVNKEYIEKVLPHFHSLLLKDFDKLLNNVELLVVNKKGDKTVYKKIFKNIELRLFDLINIPELSSHKYYHGFNW
ncbi:MAG: nucleotide sugar dehydrogenase [Bacteroidales bacterium]|nr:nucleotide sugar dehydrogenase [Bacteroidales bacterium]